MDGGGVGEPTTHRPASDPDAPARWSDSVVEALESALASARAGRSTTLVAVGEPGTGKTTLLNDVVRRAQDFLVLSAEGYLGSVSPFAVLEQWGVPAAPTSTAFMAAQALRDRVDELGRGAAVLVCLDDLQWADPESVDALVWLLRRASGDRLLALVGTRPLEANQHTGWQAWANQSSRVTSVRLEGLTEELALRLARHHHPRLPESTARTLWVHTGGNPLYLTALLTQHDPVELARMRVLPAPAEYERLVTDRLAGLDPDAVTVVQATAVLGTGWTPLPMLAAVADVDDVLGAVDRAQSAGLVQVRTAPGAPAIRPAHALARSAVYYGAALRDRRELHLRAAAVAGDVELGLEHRVQASMAFDEDLAGELTAQAEHLHQQRSFRLAGQFLEWASALTADARLRERRWLDALFERQLSGQRDDLTSELDAPGTLPSEGIRVLLLRGHAALVDGEASTAARFLSRAVAQLPDPDDHLPWSRAQVLLASAHLRTGAPAPTILADLAHARELGPTDPALGFREFYCDGVARARASSAEAVLKRLAFLPDIVSDVPVEHRDALAWRGVNRLVVGLFPEALADLREAHARAAAYDAVTDVVDGVQLSLIGISHWMLGRWDRARVTFTLLDEIVPRPQSLAEAYVCAALWTTGDLTTAESRLARLIERVEREPGQETVQALFIARVVRTHAGGSADERRGLLADMRRRWPHSFLDTGLVSSTWFMHAALAAVWAGELDLADRWIRRLEGPTVLAPWAPAISYWLRGLLAESQGRPTDALGQLRVAAGLPAETIPFYRAHLLTDHARVAEGLGRASEASHARDAAQELYRRLGAASYLVPSLPAPAAADAVAITDRQPGAGGASPDAVSASGLRERFGLSEREEDVATLVTDGMSYAQVARELFITRSTVGFHLGNIYAKVGVSSRHDLRDLVRGAVRTG